MDSTLDEVEALDLEVRVEQVEEVEREVRRIFLARCVD